jgi:hypothetical protein
VVIGLYVAVQLAYSLRLKQEPSLTWLVSPPDLSSAPSPGGWCPACRSRGGFELSIGPFVLAIRRYALVVDGGGGGQPTDVVLSDRVLQVAGTVRLLLFALGVYVH